MEVTEVKVRKLYNKPPVCAMVSVVLDNELAIHEVKIIQGEEKRFVAVPSRMEKNGVYRDLVHPLNSSMREKLERAIFSAYEEALQNEQDSSCT